MSLEIAWTKISDESSSPISRSSHGLSSVGDVLYLFGGEHLARTPLDSEIHSIDLTKSVPTWETIQPTEGNPPPPRVAHTQSVIDKRIFIFGGRQGRQIDEKPLNDLHFFDIATKQWTRVDNFVGDPPCPRSFHAMESVGGSLFVFGGCGPGGKRLNDLYQLDTETFTWINHSDGPMEGRGGAGLMVSADKSKLYVVGGFAGREMSDIYEYDISSKKWRQIQNCLPEPLSVFASVSCGSNHMIFGGEMTPSCRGHEGAGNFSAKVIVLVETQEGLELKSTKLKHDPELGPQPRGWTSAAKLQKNRFAVFGGLTGNDENPKRLNDLWICSFEN